jgi:hypothetical protein
MNGNSASAATWAAATRAARAATAAAAIVATTATTWAWLWLWVIQALHARNCFSHCAATTLGWLLKVLLSLDVFGKTFFFAKLLESAKHLID